MSASSSGSSGSIASGEILIATISPAPLAVTVTTPPPADASTRSFASSCSGLGHLRLHLLHLLEHLVHVEAHCLSSTSWASKVSFINSKICSSPAGPSAAAGVSPPFSPTANSSASFRPVTS